MRASALALASAVVASLATLVPTSPAAAAWSETAPSPSSSPVGLFDDTAKGLIYLAEGQTLHVLDASGRPVRAVAGATAWRTASWDPDGGRVFAMHHTKTAIDVIDTATSALTTVTLPEGHCAWASAFTGGRLWYSYFPCGEPERGSLAAYDPASGTFTESGLDIGFGSLRALPGDPTRLVQRDHGAGRLPLRVIDVSGTPRQTAVGSVYSNCWGFGLLDGGEHLVYSCSEGLLTILNTADLSTVSNIVTGRPGGSLTVFPGGRHFAVAGDSGTADMAKATVYKSDGTAVNTFDLGADRVVGAIASGGEGRLLSVTGSVAGAGSLLHIGHDVQRTETKIEASIPVPIAPNAPVEIRGQVTGGQTTVWIRRDDRSGSHELGEFTTRPDGAFMFTDTTPHPSGALTYNIGFDGDADRTPAFLVVGTVARTVPFDFNGDGHPEVVAGTPGQDAVVPGTGVIADAGQVHVFSGTATGVDAAGGVIIDQAFAGVYGDEREAGDRFGQVTASGDFNRDGFADLVISAPGEKVGTQAASGMVTVLYGSPEGLTAAGATKLFLNGAANAAFGAAVAPGDFDADGFEDLAVAAPGQGAGRVYVYPGRAYGLQYTAYSHIDQDTADVPGSNRDGDAFGWSLSSADVNGDGHADLAAGAPQDTEDKGWSTGSVTVFYGSSSYLTGANSQRLSKETPGVPGAAGPRNASTGDGADELGLKVVLADLNGDGKADLAASAPGTHVTTGGKDQADAGSVTVLYSGGSSIGTTGAVQITQDTEGIIGLPYDNDFFGDNLAAGDSNGDGIADLAIFSYGDEYVTVTPGTSGGLALTSTVAWTQESPGVPGSQEAGDKWGASLRFLPGPKPTLIVGAPGEDSQQGAFTVMYIGPGGLTGEGSRYFGEGSPGVPGEPENGDRFGTF